MDKRLYVELPPFTGRNVPITEIAKAIGKDAHYVRIGIPVSYTHLAHIVGTNWKKRNQGHGS